MVLFFDVDFFCVIRALFDDERSVSDALKTDEKKVLDFSLGTFRLWFCRSRCFWKSSKVNKFGTLLKVKCLILLNIFSVFPTHVGMFPHKSKGFSFCHRLPHARGDVPSGAFVSDVHPCLPHVCGDVPLLSFLALSIVFVAYTEPICDKTNNLF